MSKEFQMLAKTFKGLEQVLAAELVELGANNVQIQRRAVSFTGDMRMLYTANYCLRTASRVLVPIATFKAKKTDDIYEQAKMVDWSQYMTAKTTFQIDATVYSDLFRHSQFITYRVKDAIVDFWMEHGGVRPSVQLTNPDLYLNVHIAGDTVTLSLDSSGDSLHKRGYRVANTQAPINEALAAGMLLLAGWKGQGDFYVTCTLDQLMCFGLSTVRNCHMTGTGNIRTACSRVNIPLRCVDRAVDHNLCIYEIFLCSGIDSARSINCSGELGILRAAISAPFICIVNIDANTAVKNTSCALVNDYFGTGKKCNVLTDRNSTGYYFYGHIILNRQFVVFRVDAGCTDSHID